MKLVIAIIQPDMLNMVRGSLIKAEISRITVSRATGRGRLTETYLYRGQEVAPALLPHVRLDIACNDDYVEVAINAIVDAARKGKRGDGKIFVVPIEECVRIRTGERGGKAI